MTTFAAQLRHEPMPRGVTEIRVRLRVLDFTLDRLLTQPMGARDKLQALRIEAQKEALRWVLRDEPPKKIKVD